MSESIPQNEQLAPKKSLGDSLVNIGTRITDLSNQEVPNKKVIAGLSMIGVAGICVVVGSQVQGDKATQLAQLIGKFAETAADMGQNGAAADLFKGQADAYGPAIEAYSFSAETAFVLASEVAVIGGYEIGKAFQDRPSLIDKDGTTKISTLGPKLGGLLIKVGNSLNSKQTSKI